MEKQVIATELLKGQGLGNQLFCYVTTRALAYEKGFDFCILNREILANNIHSNKGMYFMDIDCGVDLKKEDFSHVYVEKEDRLYLGNSKHDIEHGCYVTGADEKLLHLTQSTLLYGNMQDASYFAKYKEEIKTWLKVRPEYDSKEYSKENLCIINIRGGEYTSNPELFLKRSYWLKAMAHMRKIRSDMEFMVVTDDIAAARRILPEVKAFHFDLAGDYTAIKNAEYLILSNSTFAFFPAFTSETVKYVIAPKYWARYNVSDGYWASEQNIYDEFTYMDQKGRLFSAQECREELVRYKHTSRKYKKIGKSLSGMTLWMAKCHAEYLIYQDLAVRAVRSLKRRLHRNED